MDQMAAVVRQMDLKRLPYRELVAWRLAAILLASLDPSFVDQTSHQVFVWAGSFDRVAVSAKKLKVGNMVRSAFGPGNDVIYGKIPHEKML